MNLGPEVLLQLGILSIQDSLTSKFELADARLYVNKLWRKHFERYFQSFVWWFKVSLDFCPHSFFSCSYVAFLIVLEFLLACSSGITLMPFLEYASPVIIRCQFFAGVRGCLWCYNCMTLLHLSLWSSCLDLLTSVLVFHWPWFVASCRSQPSQNKTHTEFT